MKLISQANSCQSHSINYNSHVPCCEAQNLAAPLCFAVQLRAFVAAVESTAALFYVQSGKMLRNWRWPLSSCDRLHEHTIFCCLQMNSPPPPPPRFNSLPHRDAVTR